MKQTSKNAGIGMVLGMCIGVGVGSVIDSFGIPMGLCFGMLIGLAIGANKDKIVNKQVAEKGYKIKVIEKDEVKFKIKGWCKHNRVLDYNAPCQKDTGFFFLPVSVASELVGSGRCSEMDAILDLWVNAIYNDTQVQGSELGPVVYMRNGTGNPLIGYADLAERWGVSKATTGRYLHKMQELGYLSMVAFPGTHGTAIYLKQYLSTMFQISDVLIDKDEVAMSLNLNIHIDDTSEETSVSETKSGVSKSHTKIILQKVSKILSAQGFPCFSCPSMQYKLLPLSDDCRKAVINTCNLIDNKEYRYLFVVSCKNSTELFRFEIRLVPVILKEVLQGEKTKGTTT